MRVLVVEGSRALADVVIEGLRDEGMAVDVAYDGLQAAAKLDLNPYDVVVLDRDLPGVHGDTICRMIAERENPAMVLMLTASGTPAQRVSGLSLGADDYLPKPFHFPAKEFAVLEALMRAQHAVLSTEDLFAQAWDENADPFTRTVHVTLSRLRRKLGEPPAIETITNAGYRITESH
ncbi:MAG TPA: response regulator transcription factor [Solirubrobacteraceae bacterium]|nr:response regulator transcription factor [Solirubrobacteraceae bacterium]